MPALKRTLPWLTCLLLAACGGGSSGDAGGMPPDNVFGASYTVQLAGGVPQTITAESLTLTLAAVADSRCPGQTICVSAGQAVLTVRVAQTGQAAADLSLSLDATQPRVPAEGTYRQYTVRLQALEPSPPPVGGVALSAYRATLRVERP